MNYLLTSALLCVLCIFASVGVRAQCTVPAPPAYVACASRGQSLLTNNSTVWTNDYYYNGGSATLTGINLFGDNLYVCGTVILTNPGMVGGTIFVEPGGSLTLNFPGSVTSLVDIVNYGTLAINLTRATNVFTTTGNLYNYGVVSVIGGLTSSTLLGGGVIYNALSSATMSLTGSLTAAGAMINNGVMNIANTLEFESTLCLGGGSQTSTSILDDGGTSKVTVSAAGAATTATIGITGSLTTNRGESLTSTSSLVLCEGPGFTAGGNAGNATVNPNCTINTLPVTLISFSAEAQNNLCDLDWTAEAQRGLANYEVQASTDAVNYEVVGVVSAESSAQPSIHYSYTTAIKANTWFRLRMVNDDSSYTYSDVIPVAYRGDISEDACVLRIQPNLVTGGTLQVWSNLSSGQSGEWYIVDMMGRLVLRQAVQLDDGVTTTVLQLPPLASGVYHLLFTGSRVKSAPVVFSVVR